MTLQGLIYIKHVCNETSALWCWTQDQKVWGQFPLMVKCRSVRHSILPLPTQLSINIYIYTYIVLTLKVLVAIIDAQWEGMGDVGSARYEPALLLPCPTIMVLSYSN